MDKMDISSRSLNGQALTLEEAEGKIRLAVKDGYLSLKSDSDIRAEVRSIIHLALKSLKLSALREAAQRSLTAFYARLTSQMRRLNKGDLMIFLALGKLSVKGQPNRREASVRDGASAFSLYSQMSKSRAEQIIHESPISLPSPVGNNYASALNMYHKDYIEKKVMPVLDRLAKERALDPDSTEYVGQRQTLRARAEREVRYQSHIDELSEFRSRGVKLVIISAHANCSERCRPFQGRVFSLDGTSGTTEDGRDYEPIENATNILTPNGKWYNGLFGFNCRHYMVEYKPGFKFPIPSVKEEKVQYKIDQRQRALEGHVRHWRVEAEMARGVDSDRYKYSKAKAKYWDSVYQGYSKKHGRTYFPSRTKVI